ncbi:S26 family signal peptidase [Candidatus Poseidonia sp.]|nr:S26 family signal peptidase [Poseidonia sp.]
MVQFTVEINGDSMWPTFESGQRLLFEERADTSSITVNDVVVARHPLKRGVVVVKRVKRAEGESLFLEGDHPDPLASEDSHNFGPVDRSAVLGVWLPTRKGDPEASQ